MEKTKPIRILHVLNSLNRGGAETMLMNYYRKIDRRRFQFDFVVHDPHPGDYAAEVSQLGGHIYYVPKFKGYNVFACIQAWQRIFREAQNDRVILRYNFVGQIRCKLGTGICFLFLLRYFRRRCV